LKAEKGEEEKKREGAAEQQRSKVVQKGKVEMQPRKAKEKKTNYQRERRKGGREGGREGERERERERYRKKERERKERKRNKEKGSKKPQNGKDCDWACYDLFITPSRFGACFSVEMGTRKIARGKGFKVEKGRREGWRVIKY